MGKNCFKLISVIGLLALMFYSEIIALGQDTYPSEWWNYGEVELPIVWEFVYDEGKPEWFYNVAVDSAGNFIAVGNVRIDLVSGEQAGLITKYTENGTLLWSLKLNPYLLTTLSNVAVDSGDNIIVFGATSTNRDMQDYGGSEIAAWIIAKYYPNGTLIWQKYYRKEGMGYHREGINGLAIYNDEIICTGVAGYQFRVIKLDSDGNLLWETQPSIGAQGQGLTIDKNGGIIVSGQTSLYPSSDVCLVKLSQSGEELWSKSFDWGGNEAGREVSIDADNNIVVVGEGAPPFIAKFNSEGEQIWKRDYVRANIDGACYLEVWPNRYAISVFSNAGISPPYYAEYDYNGNLVFEAIFHGGSLTKDKYRRLVSASYTGTWPNTNATLTIYNYPPYKLTIASTTGGITDPSPRTYNYHAGDIVNVTATPNMGYSFHYWLLDGEVRIENPITITMDKNHTLEAYFIDDIPPELSEPWQDPLADNVQPFQNVTVWVNVTDYGTGVKNVTLWYSLDNGTTWTILNMTALPIPSGITVTYQAIIPGCEANTWVTYKIVAFDNAGNNATKDKNGFYYKYYVVPEFPSTIILSLFLVIIAFAICMAKRRLPKTAKSN